MTNAKTKPPIAEVYRRLHAAWGPQGWWPARTRFEMMVGAILTQNTAWTNVEKAMANLRKARAISPAVIHQMPQAELALLIRPAGYFNIKAKRLKNLIHHLMSEHAGSIDRMLKGSSEEVRRRLLAINGVGKETADSIMLYAGHHPVFVVDAYTRRFMERHGWITADATYDDMAALLARPFQQLEPEKKVAVFNEYHALIVELAKRHCRNCPLNRWPRVADPVIP